MLSFQSCRPFLGFAPEVPTRGGLDYVEASRVAQLLVAHKAYVVTLNACYSAHTDGSHSNLARAFVQHGVPQVLGMSYTLVESAAPILVSTLFRAALFDNRPFSLAVHKSRQALARHPARSARFGKSVNLNDFLVPVLYYSGSDTSLNLTNTEQYPRSGMGDAEPEHCPPSFEQTNKVTHPERSRRWRNAACPPMDFISRDMDILNIERKILLGGKSSRMLMLHGPAGSGKTTLLWYLAEWWKVTKFVDSSSYIDFDADYTQTNPQTIDYILAKLYADITPTAPTSLDHTEPQIPPLQQALTTIRNRKHLIVFDHLEGAFYETSSKKWCSDLPDFPHDERGPLKSFIEKLCQDSGKSIIILSTRRKDLAKEFLPGIESKTWELGGLPLFASVEVATKILDPSKSEEMPTDQLVFLELLVQLLDCNPGALEVVLPFLSSLKKTPEQLFRLMFDGRLFSTSSKQKEMIFPPLLFTNLEKLMYMAVPSIQKVLLSTSQFWKRMPRESDMFECYLVIAAKDFDVPTYSMADDFKMLEMDELREELRRPNLDPTMRHACFIGGTELQQVMVELGWWISETDTFYRVNPLLQICLQQRRVELNVFRDAFTRVEEAVGAEIAQTLPPLPPSLNTEGFERAFIIFYGNLRHWLHGLQDRYFDDMKRTVRLELYNLVKVLDLSVLSLQLLDRCWPHELVDFLASFSQIPGIDLSKREQFLINSSIEGMLDVYELQEQKYHPSALPKGGLLTIGLSLFDVTARYYSVSKPFESYVAFVDRALALADRSIAVHGVFTGIDERNRRLLLEHRGKQLKAQGDVEKAKEILRGNLDYTLQHGRTDDGSSLGHLSHETGNYSHLATYLSLPNLSDEETHWANQQARKSLAKTIKLSSGQNLETLMERSLYLQRDDSLTSFADLRTRPLLPGSNFQTGYPESLQDYSAQDDEQHTKKAKKEANLERAMLSGDIQEQIRCHWALARLAFMEKDFQGAHQHCKDLLNFKETLSAIVMERVEGMILICSLAEQVPKNAWGTHPSATLGKEEDNAIGDSLRQEPLQSLSYPSTLSSMANLVSTYKAQGQLMEARQLFAQMVEPLNNMVKQALKFRNEGRFDEAEKLHSQILELRKIALGTDHANTIAALENLALTVEQQGRREEATKMRREVLEKRKRILGEDHPVTLETMGDLALKLKDPEEAVRMMTEVVEKRRRLHGEENEHTLLAINNLGTMFLSQSRLADAENMFQLSLQGSEKLLGSGHKLTLMILNNLSTMYRRQGKLEEMEKLVQREVQGYEKAMGPNHPSTLSKVEKLADLYRSQGKHEKAAELYQRLQQSREIQLNRRE